MSTVETHHPLLQGANVVRFQNLTMDKKHINKHATLCSMNVWWFKFVLNCKEFSRFIIKVNLSVFTVAYSLRNLKPSNVTRKRIMDVVPT